MDDVIKVGSVVRVEDPGYTYEYFIEGFAELGLGDKRRYPAFEKGEYCTVTGMMMHPRQGKLLAVVSEAGAMCIIHEKGVVKVADTYPELKKIAMDIANKTCASINRRRAEILKAAGDFPYSTQYVLEEVIKCLEARV